MLQLIIKLFIQIFQVNYLILLVINFQILNIDDINNDMNNSMNNSINNGMNYLQLFIFYIKF